MPEPIEVNADIRATLRQFLRTHPEQVGQPVGAGSHDDHYRLDAEHGLVRYRYRFGEDDLTPVEDLIPHCAALLAHVQALDPEAHKEPA